MLTALLKHEKEDDVEEEKSVFFQINNKKFEIVDKINRIFLFFFLTVVGR